MCTNATMADGGNSNGTGRSLAIRGRKNVKLTIFRSTLFNRKKRIPFTIVSMAIIFNDRTVQWKAMSEICTHCALESNLRSI